MRRFLPLLALGLVLASGALAEKEKRHRPAEFQDLTEEDKNAARAKVRQRINTFQETEPIPEYHFPFMQVGFTVLAFAVAAPFAYGAYRRAASEQQELNAAQQPVQAPKKRTRAPASDA